MPIPTPRGVIQQKPVRAKRNEDVRRRDLISSKLMQNTITTLCTHIAKTERIFIGFIVVNQIPMKRAQTPVVLSSTPTARPSSKQWDARAMAEVKKMSIGTIFWFDISPVTMFLIHEVEELEEV